MELRSSNLMLFHGVETPTWWCRTGGPARVSSCIYYLSVHACGLTLLSPCARCPTRVSSRGPIWLYIPV